MSSIFVFPGQGAQSVGMGKELYETNAAARAVFDEVDDALGEKLSDIIFNGPAEELTLTANVQPAIMATSIAMLRASGASLPEFVAGHSLGEYTALCAAGALSVGDTAKLLRARGNAMQTAVPVGRGLTAVVLGMEIDMLRKICEETGCDVANDNSPGQVVISGLKEVVEQTMAVAKDAGAKRAMPLALSVPVHCRVQSPAADAMRTALDSVEFNKPIVPGILQFHPRHCCRLQYQRLLLRNRLHCPWQHRFHKVSAYQCPAHRHQMRSHPLKLCRKSRRLSKSHFLL